LNSLQKLPEINLSTENPKVPRSDYGPHFWDIGVSDNCNAQTASYTNDTELDEKTFFTGSHKFQVKEIEVIEITE
jgi:hypothetical protein